MSVQNFNTHMLKSQQVLRISTPEKALDLNRTEMKTEW